MVDPFGRAYTGKSQNDPGEVGAWFADLDRFARGDAGITDLLVATHAGWNGERTRGASAQEDWADTIINLTRDDDDDGHRYVRASGRLDEDVDEDQLDFDPATRHLAVTGYGSRKHAKEARDLAGLVTAIVGVLTDTGAPLSTAELRRRLRADQVPFHDSDLPKASRLAEAQGRIVTEDLGPGKPTLHHLGPTPADPCRTNAPA